MDLISVQRAYRRYARHYDHLFGPVFDDGRRLAVRYACRTPGRRILEVGVGTGLSLPFYPPSCRIVGVDVSPSMLEIARRRVATERLRNVEALLQMDAQQLQMADGEFDAVVAMYVATVVPNPARLLAEMARVCAPGGDVLLVSHFASRRAPLRAIESALSPLSSLLGFRTALPLETLPQPASLERVAVRAVNLLGYWKVVHYRRCLGPARAARPPLNGKIGRVQSGAAR